MLPFVKLIDADSWRYDQPIVSIVKRSSRGLIGSDATELVKRASAELLSRARNIHIYPGEDLVHLIGIGATERWGPNRNGDGFSADVCRSQHHTFRKHAYFYRGHQNKDPRRSYGIIKESFFNEAMQRVELLVALNRTKEAADRNRGLIADDEVQRLHSGLDIPVSMACRLPFDKCSGCQHEARSRAEYCTADMCKYGGLRNKINSIAEDGHHLHAENPGAVFFDMSHVKKQADRTAQVLGIVKSAGYESPIDLLPEDVFLLGVQLNAQKAASAAWRLAEAEHRARTPAEVDRAFDRRITQTEKVARLYGQRLDTHLRALADARIVLPLSQFTELAAGPTLSPTAREKIAEAGNRTHKLFENLLSNYEIEPALANNPYCPSALRPSDELVKWASKLAPSYALDERNITRRMQSQAMRYEHAPEVALEKTAAFSENDDADEILRHYALYQLGFLGHHSGSEDSRRLAELSCRLVRYQS